MNKQVKCALTLINQISKHFQHILFTVHSQQSLQDESHNLRTTKVEIKWRVSLSVRDKAYKMNRKTKEQQKWK